MDRWKPLLENTWQYFLTHQSEFWAKTAVHLRLSVVALLIGIVVGVTLGRAGGPQ